MNKNKIILSALLSSMFTFTASAGILTPDPSPGKLPYIPAWAGSEIKDPGKRLSLTLKPTSMSMRTFDPELAKKMIVTLNYKYWDKDTYKLIDGPEWSGHMYTGGGTKGIDLPAKATLVSLKMRDTEGNPFPGLSDLRLCAYNNPIYQKKNDSTPVEHFLEVAFFENDDGELNAKIGLPQSGYGYYFDSSDQFNACKSFPIP